jgi:hypothetical protein
MSDILCARCAEPWDAYGVSNGDMEPADAIRFRRGLGCPACGFGPAPKCPECSGAGREENHTCPERCFHAKLWVWSPQNNAGGFTAGSWYTGSRPNVHKLPESLMGQRRNEPKTEFCRDGAVVRFWIPCPAEHDSCRWCGGSGFEKLSGELADERAFEAAKSEVEASDEEPIGILINRGL